MTENHLPSDPYEQSIETKESLTGSAHTTIEKMDTYKLTSQQMHETEDD